jgi:hypothetical protein
MDWTIPPQTVSERDAVVVLIRRFSHWTTWRFWSHHCSRPHSAALARRPGPYCPPRLMMRMRMPTIRQSTVIVYHWNIIWKMVVAPRRRPTSENEGSSSHRVVVEGSSSRLASNASSVNMEGLMDAVLDLPANASNVRAVSSWRFSTHGRAAGRRVCLVRRLMRTDARHASSWRVSANGTAGRRVCLVR